MTTYAYPFDPEGKLASNLIQNDQYVLTALNGRDFRCIMPKLGPFFARDFAVSFTDSVGNTTPLVMGKDYYLTHKFLSASRSCAKDIYGSLTMLRDDIVGVITITSRRLLGGEWLVSDSRWAEIVGNIYYNPRVTSWEFVANIPSMFPVVDHEYNLIDEVGMSDYVAALRSIESALRTMISDSLNAHLLDYSNPHHVSKDQVGLSDVQNFGVATISDMRSGAGNKYVIPSVLLQYLGEFASNTLSGITAQLQTAIAANTAYSEATRTELFGALSNYQTTATASIAQWQANFTTQVNQEITDSQNSILAQLPTIISTYIYSTSTLIQDIKGWISTSKSEAIAAANQYSDNTLALAKQYTDTINTQNSQTDREFATQAAAAAVQTAEQYAQNTWGNVPNYPVATQSDIDTAAQVDKFITLNQLNRYSAKFLSSKYTKTVDLRNASILHFYPLVIYAENMYQKYGNPSAISVSTVGRSALFNAMRYNANGDRIPNYKWPSIKFEMDGVRWTPGTQSFDVIDYRPGNNYGPDKRTPYGQYEFTDFDLFRALSNGIPMVAVNQNRMKLGAATNGGMSDGHVACCPQRGGMYLRGGFLYQITAESAETLANIKLLCADGNPYIETYITCGYPPDVQAAGGDTSNLYWESWFTPGIANYWELGYQFQPILDSDLFWSGQTKTVSGSNLGLWKMPNGTTGYRQYAADPGPKDNPFYPRMNPNNVTAGVIPKYIYAGSDFQLPQMGSFMAAYGQYVATQTPQTVTVNGNTTNCVRIDFSTTNFSMATLIAMQNELLANSGADYVSTLTPEAGTRAPFSD
jgi:hypothetical protein